MSSSEVGSGVGSEVGSEVVVPGSDVGGGVVSVVSVVGDDMDSDSDSDSDSELLDELVVVAVVVAVVGSGSDVLDKLVVVAVVGSGSDDVGCVDMQPSATKRQVLATSRQERAGAIMDGEEIARLVWIRRGHSVPCAQADDVYNVGDVLHNDDDDEKEVKGREQVVPACMKWRWTR